MNAQASSPGKQLELLKEVSNGGTRLGNLFNPNNEGNVAGVESVRKAAEAMSIALVLVPATNGNEIEPAFAQFAREKVAGVLVGQDGVLTALPVLAAVTSLAIAARLPTISGFRNFADAGGLMSYGSSLTALWRHSGLYAARIIKGETPGDLPFEQPTKLEMVINLKTAKAIGLDVPRSILARADDLIE
jgi:putative ABC transport system substrate-binding protein